VGAALANPAFVQVAKDLNVTIEQASYCTTVFLLFGGVTPVFVVPFASIYGRRILYLVSQG
jgi:MFS family permease